MMGVLLFSSGSKLDRNRFGLITRGSTGSPINPVPGEPFR
jgi:hypothetical protein